MYGFMVWGCRLLDAEALHDPSAGSTPSVQHNSGLNCCNSADRKLNWVVRCASGATDIRRSLVALSIQCPARAEDLFVAGWVGLGIRDKGIRPLSQLLSS